MLQGIFDVRGFVTKRNAYPGYGSHGKFQWPKVEFLRSNASRDTRERAQQLLARQTQHLMVLSHHAQVGV